MLRAAPPAKGREGERVISSRSTDSLVVRYVSTLSVPFIQFFALFVLRQRPG